MDARTFESVDGRSTFRHTSGENHHFDLLQLSIKMPLITNAFVCTILGCAYFCCMEAFSPLRRLSRTAFRPYKRSISALSMAADSEASEDKFDGSEFNEFLKSAGPVWNTGGGDSDTLKKIREEQIAREENIYRKYPFEDIKLPVLPDCNNYYSGKFGDYFWHQNADQVLVYIPVTDDITKNDVTAEFEVLRSFYSDTLDPFNRPVLLGEEGYRDGERRARNLLSVPREDYSRWKFLDLRDRR